MDSANDDGILIGKLALVVALTVPVLSGCGTAVGEGPAPATPSAPEGPVIAEPEEAKPEPKPSIPKAVGGDPLDPRAVPAGKGWTCFQRGMSIDCFRAAADCTPAQAVAAKDPSRGEDIFTECVAVKEPWCMTVLWHGKPNAPELFCFPNDHMCLHDGGYYRQMADPQPPEVVEGEKLPAAPKVASGCAPLE